MEKIKEIAKLFTRYNPEKYHPSRGFNDIYFIPKLYTHPKVFLIRTFFPYE